jgi:hypothetical protein
MLAKPFVAVWRLLGALLKITGRIVLAVLGLAFMAVGLALVGTIIGAVLGIPLMVLGLAMTLRAVF